MGTVETSLRPKIRPTKRPKKKPSEEEMADIEAGRTIKRANRLDKMISEESEGLRDNTPLEPVQQFTLGGDVRHNTNRGKTY